MTLITLFTLPAAFFITRIVTSYSQRYFARRQEELGQLNGHVEEMLGGHLVVKAFNYEKRSIEEFNYINDKLYDSSWKAEFVTGIIMPLLNLVNNISYVAVAVVGGIFVTQGRIPIGDVQAFIQYSRQFTRPIDTAANIINVFQSTIAAAERVFELLDEEEEVPDKENALSEFKPQGNVRFEHVKFGYVPGKLIMQDINIDVKSGQTVAIVGPTGAGKTTLVNLLMRFYEVNGGRITIDGVDIVILSAMLCAVFLAWSYRIPGFLKALSGIILPTARKVLPKKRLLPPPKPPRWTILSGHYRTVTIPF